MNLLRNSIDLLSNSSYVRKSSVGSISLVLSDTRDEKKHAFDPTYTYRINKLNKRCEAGNGVELH